ncbi:MAG: hypothetical protein CM15mP23_02750 [Cryomorphaceae bacterium]|nr:MAG: hypothetical protein CM15mP23_02750 [Cryomorphaceae bacterium]
MFPFILLDSVLSFSIEGKLSVANSRLELPFRLEADPFKIILGKAPKTPTFS